MQLLALSVDLILELREQKHAHHNNEITGTAPKLRQLSQIDRRIFLSLKVAEPIRKANILHG